MNERQKAAGPPKPPVTLREDLVTGAPAMMFDEALSDDELDALCETMLAAIGDDVPPVSSAAKTLAQA